MPGVTGEALDAALAAFAGVVGRIECDRVGSGVAHLAADAASDCTLRGYQPRAQKSLTGECAHVTAFERCDRRHRSAVRQRFIFWTPKLGALPHQCSGGDGRPSPWAGRAVILRTMKGFGKIAILFGLLGGVMAYFIIPVQFTRSRAPYHQPTRPSTSGPSVTIESTAGQSPKH